MNGATRQEHRVRFGRVDGSWERHAVRAVERFDVAHDANGLRQLSPAAWGLKALVEHRRR